MQVSSEPNGRIKVAICGELNSGKTSFIRAVLRDTVIPDLPTGVDKPIIRVTLADGNASIQYRTKDGAVLDAASVDAIPTDGSVAEVTIPSPIDTFGNCEFIEFPALNDRHISQAETDPIGDCDIFVWMTIGSQAWRLSEKTIIDKIPNRSRETSMLVVSRTDKFRSSSDQERLTTRLSSETSGHFAKGAMLGASPQGLLEAQSDEDAWAEIGAKDIAATLTELIARARTEQPDTADDTAIDALDQIPDALGAPVGYHGIQRVRRPKKYWRGRGDPVLGVEDTPAVEDLVAASTEVTPEPDRPQEDTPAVAVPEAVVAEEPAEVAAPVAPTVQDAADDIESIAQGVEGLVSLATFKADEPSAINLIAGQSDQAKEFATQLSSAGQFVLSDPTFDGVESVHMTLKSHQILYGPIRSDGTILMLVCRTANPGLARSAFARMTTNYQDLAAA